MDIVKIITINNRELLRRYRFYREQLVSGEVDRIVIPVNGKKLYMEVLPEEKIRPGDIRPLLEKLKREGPRLRIKPVKIEWSMKSFKLMEKLLGQKKKKNN